MVYNELESVSYLDSMVWSKLPVEYKEIESFWSLNQH